MDGKEVSELKGIQPPKAQKQNKSIVVLRMQSRALTDNSIEELEKKYSKKFGCKVVILEANLEMVDHING